MADDNGPGTPESDTVTNQRGVLTGIALAVLAGFLFVSSDSIVKLAREDLPVAVVVWGRFAAHLMLMLILFPGRRLLPLFKVKQPALVIGRGILLLICTGLFFTAIGYIGLAEANSIMFVSPFFVVVLSIPLLGEKVGARRWSAVIIGFLGILLILRPGIQDVHWAYFLILGVAFFFALFSILTRTLRVRPETLCRITEFSEHESNGRELDEGERVAVEVLPVLGQSAAAVEPGDGAFDHPTPGLDDEALHPIGSLDDLGLEIGQDAGQGAVKDRALIGAVGEQFPEKGKQTEQGRQQRETAAAILNGGGGDDAVQQQALRIDQNMPLLALDQLAGIEAVAVDASPPFSALFTL